MAGFAPLRAIAGASAYAREVVWHSPQATGIDGLAVVVHLTSVAIVVILANDCRALIPFVLVPPDLRRGTAANFLWWLGARELAMIASLGLADVPRTTALARSRSRSGFSG